MVRLPLLLAGCVLTLRAGLAAGQRAPERAPDECFGFSFGPWNPPLHSVASASTPGDDPVAGRAAPPPGDAPRESAARLASDAPSGDPARDSVLVLFPGWWPAGVSVEWRETRGDTMVGIARALVADGRFKNPVSAVRAIRLPCARTPATRTP